MSTVNCDPDAEPLIEYIGDHETVFLIGAIIGFVFLALYICNVIWTRSGVWHSKKSETLHTAEQLGVALLRHFTPTMAVDNYRFRGMEEKSLPITVKFDNLGLKLKDGRLALAGVSGQFDAGRLAGIMGPSGAGKTTFMNVLCGKARYGKMSGSVLVNNGDMTLEQIKPEMGFVPQDDVVHELLTVRENLYFAACLRTPQNTCSKKIEAIVEDVMTVLQVSHIQNSIVGGVESRGISGGQRKRVNIGLELAACPSLLFLDEPTSGLDATSSLQIINSLGKMTKLNMNIIMVIHQPRYGLFCLLNDVLLLGVGGKTVYLGPSSHCKSYFEDLGYSMPPNENPSDWFMDVLSGAVKGSSSGAMDLPAVWCQHMEKNAKKEILDDDMPSNETISIDDIPVRTQKSAQVLRRSLGMSMKDVSHVLVTMVTEEWTTIAGSDLLLNRDELEDFIQKCVPASEVSSTAVDEIMKRIAGSGEEATLEDALSYFEDMLGTIAHDQASANNGRASIGDAHIFHSSPLDKLKMMISNSRSRLPWNQGPQGPIAPRSGFWTQLFTILERRLIQLFRESRTRCLDLTLCAVCSFGLGFMDMGSVTTNQSQLGGKMVMFLLGISLLSATSTLKIFRNDRSVFWRERARGVNVAAFTAARVIGAMADVVLQTFLFTTIYMWVARPPVHFVDYFYPSLLVSFAAASWGFFLSVALPPNSSTVAVVLFCLLNVGVVGDPQQLPDIDDGSGRDIVILIFSFSRWSIPMMAQRSVDRAVADGFTPCISNNVLGMLESYKGATSIFGELDAWDEGVATLLLVTATVLLLTYLSLRFLGRGKII